jgi:hypothetical protein
MRTVRIDYHPHPVLPSRKMPQNTRKRRKTLEMIAKLPRHNNFLTYYLPIIFLLRARGSRQFTRKYRE